MIQAMSQPTSTSFTSADPDFREDPHRAYDRIRSAADLSIIHDYDCRFVTQHDAVRQGLKHKSFSVDARLASPASYMRRIAGTGVKESIGDTAYEPPLVLLDDPAHRDIRTLVSKAFNPQTIEHMRPRVAQITTDLLEAMEGQERIDFIADFAGPLPTRVILEMMGLPADLYPECKQWSEEILWGYDPERGLDRQRRLRAAYLGMSEVFRSALAQRQQTPGNDLISDLAQAQAADNGLTELQIISLCTQLMVAGNVTTTDLIGNGVYHLATHRDQLSWLKQNLECIDGAVEEMLRYDCPITETARIAKEPDEFAGCPVQAGDTLTLSLSAANHDPAVFERPHEFNLQRAPLNHLGFGSGIHVCLGAPLARMESQIGIAQFVQRHPHFRLVHDQPPKRRALPFFRGFETLPLQLQ